MIATFGTIVISGILISLIIWLFFRENKVISWILFILYTGFSFVLLLRLYGQWQYYEAFKNIMYLGNIKIKFTLQNNMLGWVFAILIFGISFFNGLFSLGFSKSKYSKNIVPLWTLILSASILILFAKDFILFFIGWEYLTWPVFFIVNQGKKKFYSDAMYYFALNVLGGMALMLGIWMVFKNTQTLDIRASISILLSHKASIHTFWLLTPFFIAFLVKSAAYPFHVWAPRAHSSAPADFSPFISGIMIKFGIFGILLFLYPLLSKGFISGSYHGVPTTAYFLSWLGIITSVVATVLGFSENNMKRLMAYSSVANVGYILTAIFLITPLGIEAGIFHTINHMIFKVIIFITLAAVYFRTGTADMSKLGGMAYKMPITFMTFLIGIIAAAGVFPMNGFASKWIIFQAILEKHFYLMAVAMFFASTGAFLYLYRALHSIFLGQIKPEHRESVKEVPFLMQIPMWVGMIVILAIGVFPGLVLKPLIPFFHSIGLPSKYILTSLSKLPGSFGQLNTLNAMIIFSFSAILVTILFFVVAKHHKKPFMDNYTAGEDPKDWGVDENRYQFAYGFYQPFEKKFLPFFKHSVDMFWQYFGFYTKHLGEWFNNIFKDDNNFAYIAVIGIVIVFIFGGFAL